MKLNYNLSLLLRLYPEGVKSVAMCQVCEITIFCKYVFKDFTERFLEVRFLFRQDTLSVGGKGTNKSAKGKTF